MNNVHQKSEFLDKYSTINKGDKVFENTTQHEQQNTPLGTNSSKVKRILLDIDKYDLNHIRDSIKTLDDSIIITPRKRPTLLTEKQQNPRYNNDPGPLY